MLCEKEVANAMAIVGDDGDRAAVDTVGEILTGGCSGYA